MNKTERDELIIKLRKQDKTFTQIAEEVGCGKATVRKVIRNYQGDDIRKEQLTTEMSFEQAQAKYCPEGFELLEYHPGQTDGYIRLKCKNCGHEFTKLRTSFAGANAKYKTHCAECDRIDRENRERECQAERQREQDKKQRERELKRKATQLSFNICPVCKEVFQGKRKFCSEECSKWNARKEHKQLRRVRIKSHIVDRDITLNALAMRDHDKCWLCNGNIDWNDYVIIDGSFMVGERYPSIDHVIPLSKNGLHAWQNVKLAHFGCNRDKGAEIV